jgi:outer membrane protein TolC
MGSSETPKPCSSADPRSRGAPVRRPTFGPSVTWNFLQVHAQDAAFQEALITCENTVLVAQQEVENALIGFRKQQEKAKSLSEAVRAAQPEAS